MNFNIGFIVLCVVIFPIAYATYVAGRFLGRKDVLDRLLDAKDAEAWQYAHYVRADIKQEMMSKAKTERIHRPIPPTPKAKELL